jgi:hypothetical protein
MKSETSIVSEGAAIFAYVRIRQHTAAYGSIRQHTPAYVSIRLRTAAYGSIRQHTSACETRIASEGAAIFAVVLAELKIVVKIINRVVNIPASM